jgi:hypothetical protein
MPSQYIEPKSPKSPHHVIIHSHFASLNDQRFDTSGDYVVNKGVRHLDSDSGSDISELKTTRDGSIVLIPQPSGDPQDPLNWSFGKKAAVFACIIPGCFLTDWVRFDHFNFRSIPN